MSLLCASKVVCSPFNTPRQMEETASGCLIMRRIMDAVLVLNLGYLLWTGLFCPDCQLENMGMGFKACPEVSWSQ